MAYSEQVAGAVSDNEVPNDHMISTSSQETENASTPVPTGNTSRNMLTHNEEDSAAVRDSVNDENGDLPLQSQQKGETEPEVHKSDGNGDMLESSNDETKMQE